VEFLGDVFFRIWQGCLPRRCKQPRRRRDAPGRHPAALRTVTYNATLECLRLRRGQITAHRRAVTVAGLGRHSRSTIPAPHAAYRSRHPIACSTTPRLCRSIRSMGGAPRPFTPRNEAPTSDQRSGTEGSILNPRSPAPFGVAASSPVISLPARSYRALAEFVPERVISESGGRALDARAVFVASTATATALQGQVLFRRGGHGASPHRGGLRDPLVSSTTSASGQHRGVRERVAAVFWRSSSCVGTSGAPANIVGPRRRKARFECLPCPGAPSLTVANPRVHPALGVLSARAGAPSLIRLGILDASASKSRTPCRRHLLSQI